MSLWLTLNIFHTFLVLEIQPCFCWLLTLSMYLFAGYKKKERRVIFGENKAATHKSYWKLRSLKILEYSLENTCDIGLLIILFTQRVQIYENEGSNKEIFHKWYFSELRVQQLAYVAYVSTPTFIGVRMILNMSTLTRTLIFSFWFFQIFQNLSGSYNFILFKNLLI